MKNYFKKIIKYFSNEAPGDFIWASIIKIFMVPSAFTNLRDLCVKIWMWVPHWHVIPLLSLHIWINVYQTLAKEKELKKLLYLLCFHIRKGKGQITHESI